VLAKVGRRLDARDELAAMANATRTSRLSPVVDGQAAVGTAAAGPVVVGPVGAEPAVAGLAEEAADGRQVVPQATDPERAVLPTAQ
jgi:hypothetical protein